MKRVLTVCVFIAMVTAISLPVYSGEIYMWIDEKGGKHITDRPPEKPAKIIDVETYKRDSPDEIQNFQAEQKANEQRQEAEHLQRQQINRAQEEADRAREEAARNKQQQRDQQKDKEELRCYTVQSPGVLTGAMVTGGTVIPGSGGMVTGGAVTGGVVTGGASWYICKDKNGKIVSKTRL
jgi:hypothetical protein